MRLREVTVLGFIVGLFFGFIARHNIMVAIICGICIAVFCLGLVCIVDIIMSILGLKRVLQTDRKIVYPCAGFIIGGLVGGLLVGIMMAVVFHILRVYLDKHRIASKYGWKPTPWLANVKEGFR